MKKTIATLFLAACLAMLGVVAFAQTKTDTAKAKAAPAEKPKPVYHADPSKMYHIEFNIRSYQLKAITEQLDGLLDKDDSLKPEALQAMKDECKFFKHIIMDEIEAREDYDYQKFMADTSGIKPAVPDKKKKQ